MAASNGHKRCAQLLIDKGANIDGDPTIAGTTPPLFIAAFNGHDNMVESLLVRGANPLVRFTTTQHTVLDAAVHSGNIAIVRRLLNEPIDISAKDAIGQTALHQAAISGHEAIVRLLIDAGTSLGEVSENGWLPIHGAALHGHREALLVLLQRGSRFGSLQGMFEDNLQKLFESNPNALGRLFITHRQAWKTMETAVMNADLTALHTYLAQSTNVNRRDGKGITALHLAASKGHKEIVQVLIEQYKSDVDARTIDGSTTLHRAAEAGHVDIVLLLLGNGAALNCITFFGYTALHYAVIGGHEDVVRILVQEGIDVMIESRKGLTALQIAKKMNKCTIAAILSDNINVLH